MFEKEKRPKFTTLSNLNPENINKSIRNIKKNKYLEFFSTEEGKKYLESNELFSYLTKLKEYAEVLDKLRESETKVDDLQSIIQKLISIGEAFTFFLKHKKAQEWLSSNLDILKPNGVGLPFLYSKNGEEWLKSPEGQSWRNSKNGEFWFVSTSNGEKWLKTDDGSQWFYSNTGKNWQKTFYGKQYVKLSGKPKLQLLGIVQQEESVRPERVRNTGKLVNLPASNFENFGNLLEKTGRKVSNLERNYMGEGINKEMRKRYASSELGKEWLKTDEGKEWLKSNDGQNWLKSNNGQKHLRNQSSNIFDNWLKNE